MLKLVSAQQWKTQIKEKSLYNNVKLPQHYSKLSQVV